MRLCVCANVIYMKTGGLDRAKTSALFLAKLVLVMNDRALCKNFCPMF